MGIVIRLDIRNRLGWACADWHHVRTNIGKTYRNWAFAFYGRIYRCIYWRYSLGRGRKGDTKQRIFIAIQAAMHDYGISAEIRG